MVKAAEASIKFARAIERKFDAQQHTEAEAHGYTAPDFTVQVMAGQKYDRLVQSDGSYNRSVHAFVRKSDGALIKAAGWKAPQKNADGTDAVRFDLSTPAGMHEAIESADRFGSYLYVR